MAYCEDYPCCGHTSQDPCDRQWYDDPAKVRRHLDCDHENGICEVYNVTAENEEFDDDDDDEWLDEALNHDSDLAEDRWLDE